jgi:hypothetical protein
MPCGQSCAVASKERACGEHEALGGRGQPTGRNAAQAVVEWGAGPPACDGFRRLGVLPAWAPGSRSRGATLVCAPLKSALPSYRSALMCRALIEETVSCAAFPV